ncbi:MAG: ParB/RepB/Spo0J family partition protein [Bacilli bacterium]|nr:ParB/RepB/Spo0J family partition protein [Bacilli bacterium]
MIKEELKNQLKKNLLDDMFTTQEQRDDAKREKVIDIKITDIDDFPKHPFKVLANEDMKNMIASVKEYGVLSPALVRQKSDGRYEMLSGHRRKFASQCANLNTIPCIVRNLTDDEATILMIDSNLSQREKILPSERAFAYKMKLEAIKHQGRKECLTSTPLVEKLSSEIIGSENNESREQVRRYIRLTYLNTELLDLVDNGTIAFRPAVELSYLKKDEQEILVDFIKYNQSTPSLEQAIKLKKLSQENLLDVDEMHDILSSLKPNQKSKLKFDRERLRTVLPKNIEENKIEDYVVKSIEYYTKYLRHKNRESR